MKKIVLLLVIALFANVAFAQSIKERLRRERMREKSGGKVNTSVPIKKKTSESGKWLNRAHQEELEQVMPKVSVEECSGKACKHCKHGVKTWAYGKYCVDCMWDSDCLLGFQCQKGECVPHRLREKMECRKDFDCKKIYYDKRMACIDYKCREVECLNDSQCSSKQDCINNACHQSQTVDYEDCRSLDCLNCKSGNQRLLTRTTGIGDNSRMRVFCGECFSKSDCIDGYMCNNNTCMRR